MTQKGMKEGLKTRISAVLVFQIDPPFLRKKLKQLLKLKKLYSLLVDLHGRGIIFIVFFEGKLLAESVDSPDSLAGESREYVPSAIIRCLRKQQILRDLFEKSLHFIRRQYVERKICQKKNF